jgi:hypothetical protein
MHHAHNPNSFAVFRARQIALILSFAAVLASLWLGYLLIFSIKVVASYL